ncbi:MAG: hypothetical protein JWQ71_1640 [Pedosphaera sp.]|nr:hypothetical protein [Pedosphaera sp.]
MFAANISTVHLVSLTEAGYKYRLAFGNFASFCFLPIITHCKKNVVYLAVVGRAYRGPPHSRMQDGEENDPALLAVSFMTLF